LHRLCRAALALSRNQVLGDSHSRQGGKIEEQTRSGRKTGFLESSQSARPQTVSGELEDYSRQTPSTASKLTVCRRSAKVPYRPHSPKRRSGRRAPTAVADYSQQLGVAALILRATLTQNALIRGFEPDARELNAGPACGWAAWAIPISGSYLADPKVSPANGAPPPRPSELGWAIESFPSPGAEDRHMTPPGSPSPASDPQLIAYERRTQSPGELLIHCAFIQHTPPPPNSTGTIFRAPALRRASRGISENGTCGEFGRPLPQNERYART
jgi:hypothetical protein